MNNLSPALLSSPYKKQIMGELKNAEDWAKLFTGNHLEPGVVAYDQGNGQKKTFLLTREAIEAMRKSAEGKPIVGKSGNYNHKKVSPDDYKNGGADGVAVESFDGAQGWEKVRFMVWDGDTKEKCLDGYQLSCAYIPTEVKEEPGLWHNVKYDAVIMNGEYTHFCVVPNPRYEGAVIFANSLKEGMEMFKLWFKKGGKEQTVELDKTTVIKMDGRDVPLSELVNAMALKQAAEAQVKTVEEAKDAMNDDSELDIDGKKVKLGELKAAYTAKCNAEAGQIKEDIITKHANELKESSVSPAAQAAIEHLAKLCNKSPEEVLKDIRGDSRISSKNAAPPDPAIDAATSGVSGEQKKEPAMNKSDEEKAAKEAEKAAADAAKAKENADKSAEEKAKEELAKKNAAGWTCDGCGHKFKTGDEAVMAFVKGCPECGEHKVNKNAEEEKKKAEKAELEKKNALEKTLKERKEKFNALKIAAEERGSAGIFSGTGVVTPGDKESLGQSRYGSGK